MSRRRHIMGLELIESDYRRFQALCRARQANVTVAVQAMITAQVAQPDRLLSDSLCIPISPALRRELAEYARERGMSLAQLVEMALGRMVNDSRPQIE